ncbi:MAG: hypothetical protein DI528_14025 [Shinella sp.]|nr:MAG: hypothetical protein DI528_14025 [Shinella sp.]
MIEYGLLFGLGFMAAALVVMLIAPAIHQRIVLYTENRLKATMPLSPQEIRAQKDMARAVYAAENARTTQELTREREKSIALKLSNEQLGHEASRLVAENQDLHAQINEMSVEAAEFRSKLRRAELEADNLKEALKRTEENIVAKGLEIEAQSKRLRLMASDIDNMRIEASSRETEIENLKMRVQTLRDEREELRRETKLLTKRAKDAEQRLSQEEHKLLRLDDRLARQMSENVDKDATIDRRLKEIARLKQNLKSANGQLRQVTKTLRGANLPVPDFKESEVVEEEVVESAPTLQAVPALEIDIEGLAEELRHRHTALTERLLKAKSPANDDALREEIADIAAKMIVITAHREGDGSPIPGLLRSKSVKGANAHPSLAERALALDPALGGKTSSQHSAAE